MSTERSMAEARIECVNNKPSVQWKCHCVRQSKSALYFWQDSLERLLPNVSRLKFWIKKIVSMYIDISIASSTYLLFNASEIGVLVCIEYIIYVVVCRTDNCEFAQIIYERLSSSMVTVGRMQNKEHNKYPDVIYLIGKRLYRRFFLLHWVLLHAI